MVNTQIVSDPLELQIAELTGAIEKQPSNPSLYNRRSQLYLKKNDYQAALADADKAIELSPSNGELHFNRATILRKAGSIAQAMKAAEQAEQLHYDQAELYVLIGDMYFILKEYQKAIDNLNRALKLSPFNEQAYFYKGLVYNETGDEQRAISNFQTAIDQAPEFVEPYNELAKIYTNNKDYQTALQYINSGLRFNPEDPFLWYNQGVALQAQQHPDSAITSFRRALHFDSTLYLANFNIGVLHYNSSRYKDAIPYLERVLRQTNRMPETLLLLADSYEQTNQLDKAQQYYSMAKEQDPENRVADAGLARVQRKRNAAPKDTARAQQ